MARLSLGESNLVKQHDGEGGAACLGNMDAADASARGPR